MTCINLFKENFEKQVNFVMIINSSCSNNSILAPWRGLPSCPCTGVTSMVKPVQSAASPETLTVPGMAPPALAISLLRRGRDDIGNKQNVCYLLYLTLFLKQPSSCKYTNFSISKKNGLEVIVFPLFLSQNNQKNV